MVAAPGAFELRRRCILLHRVLFGFSSLPLYFNPELSLDAHWSHDYGPATPATHHCYALRCFRPEIQAALRGGEAEDGIWRARHSMVSGGLLQTLADA